jgi:hypothetical protein
MNRTTLTVITIHVFLLFLVKFTTPEKKVNPKPLKVKTIIQAPPPKSLPAPLTHHAGGTAAAPTVKKALSKTVKKSPPRPVKKVNSKTQETLQKDSENHSSSEISAQLLQQLQESIAKIDKTSDKENLINQFQTPKAASNLTVEQVGEEDQADYANALVACLKRNLSLPERGDVKIELLIEKSGVLNSYSVITSRSLRNQRYLENELGALRYPAFMGSLKSKQEHKFVISFSNY